MNIEIGYIMIEIIIITILGMIIEDTDAIITLIVAISPIRIGAIIVAIVIIGNTGITTYADSPTLNGITTRTRDATIVGDLKNV